MVTRRVNVSGCELRYLRTGAGPTVVLLHTLRTQLAFLSLCRHWRNWIAARAVYANVKVPVTLVYAEHDWSRPGEREANARALSTARTLSLAACGHFASLERPQQIAGIIRAE
jgi:pimeloyl-ACP methyl ester carboxylesterase